MNRRDFLSGLALGGATLALSRPLKAAGAALPAPVPKPRPGQLAWQEAELVAMYHYDLHLFDAPGEKHRRYNQGANRLRKFPGTDAFNPTQIDVDQWVRSAVDMGAKAAVMTSCHENGLRLWRSDANPYSLRTTKWGDGKRDLVGEFADACRKHGIKPGFFHCQRWNSLLRVHDFRVMKDCPYTQDEYRKMLEKEIEELTTRYGELFMLWFDGGALTPAQGGPDMAPIFAKNQPHGIFYHSDQRRDLRWAGNENGVTGENCSSNFDLSRQRTGHDAPAKYLGSGDPDGPDFCPALADTPLRGKGGHEWFWEPDDERLILPLADLMRMYERSVGRNATLVVGLTPDNRGLLPEADVRRVKEFGDRIRARWGRPLAATAGEGEGEGCTLTLEKATVVDRAVLGEDTRDGERIRKYLIEVRAAPGAPWTKVAEGTVVGHKRIANFPALAASSVRLRVTESRGKARLREFSVFAAGE